MSDSFAGAKSTGDAEKDQIRADEMITGVDDILARQETGDMTPPIEMERGGMWWYCRPCKLHGEVTYDIETEYEKIVCTTCGNKVYVGTEMSVRTYFHIK